MNIAPPPLPVYEQPVIPGDGYIWTPGYWAYSDDGYFWVPGTWVRPPTVGYLWTPGYWGWGGGYYAFHSGYWGPHIGFYGGINYGYGYGGYGYEGGYWNHGGFYYNRGINNFGGVHITNVYNRTVINNVTINNVQYELQWWSGWHRGQTPWRGNCRPYTSGMLRRLRNSTAMSRRASHNRAMFASVNHGAPAIAATSRPGEFSGAGVVAAHPLSEQDRGAAAKAEAAKPIGPSVKTAAEMSAHTPVHAMASHPRSTTHAMGVAHSPGHHESARSIRADHGNVRPLDRSADVHHAERGPAQVHESHPMARAPHPMAQVAHAPQHAPQRGPAPPKKEEKDHH